MSRYDLKGWGGSGGSLAGDVYRENKGQAAANALIGSGFFSTVSGDHLNANELCTEVLVRLANVKPEVSDAANGNKVANAITNLKVGLGYGKKQADHSGSNTCIDVIGAATS